MTNSNYAVAEKVLGGGLILPEDVRMDVPVHPYTTVQFEQLRQALPTYALNRTLKEWGGPKSLILVSGPPEHLSLADIRDLVPSFFSPNQESQEEFWRRDTVGPGWIMLAKEALLGSLYQHWWGQQGLLRGPVVVPNLPTVAWCLVVYAAVRGIRLLPRLYVRTASLDSGGQHTSIGQFDAGGLQISFRNDDEGRSSDLGLAVASVFPLNP